MMYHHSRATAQRDGTFQRIARRFNGRAFQGGMFGGSQIRFEWHGASVLVDYQSTGGKHSVHYTQLSISWPDMHTRCEIYPERFASRVGKMMGMLDVEIGSPAFDKDFIISGNSVGSLRDLLTPDVQASIYRLRRLHDTDDVYVAIGGGRMRVKKEGLLRSEPELTAFIEAALDLHDRATSENTSGIEIISTVSASSAEDVICQICGEGISEELVHCRRCHTPHHEDCWVYFGGCSTFGCGEKRYTSRGV